MIERLANAIAEALVKQADGIEWDLSRDGSTPVFGYIDFGKYDVTDLARAVVEALREPSQAMLDAAVADTRASVVEFVGPDEPALHFVNREEVEAHAKRLLGVMLDAILEETP